MIPLPTLTNGQSRTCQGACCVVFSYTLDHLELKHDRSTDGDDSFVRDMLVPLSAVEALERYERLVPEGERAAIVLDGIAIVKKDEDDGHPGRLYTCRHWVEQTRLCGVYASRPRMCSDYPYGKPCGHGCGYTRPRGFPINPNGKRNLSEIGYLAGRYSEIARGAKNLGVA